MTWLSGWLQRKKKEGGENVWRIWLMTSSAPCFRLMLFISAIITRHGSRFCILTRSTLYWSKWLYSSETIQEHTDRCLHKAVKLWADFLLKLWISTSFQLQNFCKSFMATLIFLTWKRASRVQVGFIRLKVNCASSPILTNMIFPQLTLEMLQVFITSNCIGPWPLEKKGISSGQLSN